MTNDLIHEVEESIKQEQLEKFWKEYGSYIIAAAILAVLITALVSGYRAWNAKINTSQTTALIEALDQDDKVAALDGITPTMRPSHRAISYLTAAGLLADDGKQEEALKHYQTAANDRDIEPVFRDLAQLMAVRLEFAMEKPGANPQSFVAALQPIWENAQSPWRYHAHEQAALILAHAQNDYVNARAHLRAILEAKEGVMPSMQERARALDHVYVQKISAAAAEKPADAPAETKEKPEG